MVADVLEMQRAWIKYFDTVIDKSSHIIYSGLHEVTPCGLVKPHCITDIGQH